MTPVKYAFHALRRTYIGQLARSATISLNNDPALMVRVGVFDKVDTPFIKLTMDPVDIKRMIWLDFQGGRGSIE